MSTPTQATARYALRRNTREAFLFTHREGMTEYQRLVIDQFKEQERERRLNPRKTNDLPIEILGRGAFWCNPGLSSQGNDKPSSYHVTIDNIDYPIKFVNKQWCYLVWDDTEKFRGYWVKPSNLIPQGQHSLGWIGNQPEIATPTVTRRLHVSL